MNSVSKWKRGGWPLMAALICLAGASALMAEEEAHDWGPATKIALDVRNRLYPDFVESHRVEMHQRVQVGDTDYFFEVVDFFPHFALIDSTKEVVSLSHEPKNVAFKFAVFENDSIVDTSWSFYTIQIPHYARTSYLYFNVKEFEYRGEAFRKDAE
jgi:hypothetical protein